MIITLHRGEHLQIVVGDALYALHVDSRQIVSINGIPLIAAIDAYVMPKASEQFVESISNVKVIKPDKLL